MTSKKCEKTAANSVKGGFVEVPIDPEFPEGWKKKVYELNGRLMPKWTIWFDNEGNKFVNEKKVRAKLAAIKENENTKVEGLKVESDAHAASLEAKKEPVETKSEDLKIVYNARKSIEPSTNFTCVICSLDFATKEEFNGHNNLHKSLENPSKSMERVVPALQHTNNMTDQLPYKCFVCGKMSLTKTDLEKHQLVHSKLQPYSCEICQKRFSQMGNLHKHKRNTHTLESYSVGPEEMGHQVVREDLTKNKLSASENVNLKAGFLVKQEQKVEAKVWNSENIEQIKAMNVNPDQKTCCDVCYKGYSTRKNMMRHRNKDHPAVPLQQVDNVLHQRQTPSKPFVHRPVVEKNIFSGVKNQASSKSSHPPQYGVYIKNRKPEKLITNVVPKTAEFASNSPYGNYFENIKREDSIPNVEKTQIFPKNTQPLTKPLSSQYLENIKPEKFVLDDVEAGQPLIKQHHGKNLENIKCENIIKSESVNKEEYSRTNQPPMEPHHAKHTERIKDENGVRIENTVDKNIVKSSLQTNLSLPKVDPIKSQGKPTSFEQYIHCDICVKPFTSRAKMLRHRTNFHPEAPICTKETMGSIKCDLCDKGYSSRDVMLRHKKRYHIIETMDSQRTINPETKVSVDLKEKNSIENKDGTDESEAVDENDSDYDLDESDSEEEDGVNMQATELTGMSFAGPPKNKAIKREEKVDNTTVLVKNSNSDVNLENSNSLENKVYDDLDHEFDAVTETLINKLSDDNREDSQDDLSESESETESEGENQLLGLEDEELAKTKKNTKEYDVTRACGQISNVLEPSEGNIIISYEVQEIQDAELEQIKCSKDIENVKHENKMLNEAAAAGPIGLSKSGDDPMVEDDELDESVVVEDMDLVFGLDEVYDDQEMAEYEDNEANEDEKHDDGGLNKSLDIVTDFYNKIMMENSEILGKQAEPQTQETTANIVDKEPSADVETLDDETETHSYGSFDANESIEEISPVAESLDTSLDIATDYYNRIVQGNSSKLPKEQKFPEVSNVENIPTRLKNVISDDHALPNDQSNVLEVDDEIMFSPGSRQRDMEKSIAKKPEGVEPEISQDVSKIAEEKLNVETLRNVEQKSIQANTNTVDHTPIQAICQIEEHKQIEEISETVEQQPTQETSETAGQQSVQEIIDKARHNIAQPSKLQCKLCPEEFSKKKLLKKHLIEHKLNLLSNQKSDIPFVQKVHEESLPPGNVMPMKELNTEPFEESIISVEATRPMAQMNAIHPSEESISPFPKHTGESLNTCLVCKKTFSQKSNLNHHIRKVHKIDDVKSASNQTEVRKVSKKRELEETGDAKDPRAIKRLKTSKDAQNLECNQCPKTFKAKQALKSHTESIHEGIKQSCDSCEYQANSVAQLKVHKQAEHEGVTHPCQFCDYVTRFRTSLIAHLKRKHTDGL